MCVLVLDTAFKGLETWPNGVVKFRLVTGWLDLLLNLGPKAKEQPAKLDTPATASLFSQLSVYLKKHLNLGGNEGAELGSEITFLKVKIGTDLLEVLLSAQSVGGSN
jgi:hypothetical protein